MNKPKNIRVLMVAHAVPVIGGLEMSFSRLSAALLARGIEPSALLIGGSGDPPSAMTRHLTAQHATGWSAILRAVRAVDVVHLHAGSCSTWPRSVPWLAALARRPLVVTIHLPAYPPAPPWSLGRLRMNVHLYLLGLCLGLTARRVFAPSLTAAQTVNRRLGPWVSAQPLLNGVPDTGFRRQEPGPIRLAWVGRLDPHKKPLLFVQVVQELVLRGCDVSADMLGEGPLEAEVRSLIETLGLEGRIVLGGQQSQPELAMARCHILVLTSSAEGCPLVAMEAAALGRGVVARCDLEGVSELWGPAAVLVASDAGPHEFAEAIERLVHGPDELTRIGAASRELYERLFDVNIASAAWSQQYRDASGVSAK